MISNSDLKQNFQQRQTENFGKISTAFLEISDKIKTTADSSELNSKIDKLFKLILESNQFFTNELSSFLDQNEKILKHLENLKEENRKLQVLYSTGIVFSSETEMKALMESAIETVVKELKADSGFIILTDDLGSIESVFAKNMNPQENPEALNLSSTVVRNTLQISSPVRIDKASEDDELAGKSSVIKLGISAVLCVPLIAGSKTLGAVYLDRRKKENPFTHSDLLYLLSFAKQIIRGLQVSLEISSLEKKLLTDAVQNFEDFRKEFKCEKIIGSNKKLFELLKIAAKISPTDASVVILGENGTGKDLLARAIHENSRRKDKPFVTIDCSSIPADLLESELFGYESGAFTGATKSKPGKLEIADGGTIFFDEIGEMSVNLQAKLLRVIQTKELERLGSVQTKKIDVRILCATNKNISEMISKGQFREDLYYRLKVIELTLPPLRQRKDDIFELSNFFLKKHASDGKTFSISEEALQILEDYNWPGNIRELENVILRCVVLAKSDMIEPSDLPSELIDKTELEERVEDGKTLLDAETEFRRMFILRTLRKAKTKAEAAQLLGINRTHFYKLLSQLGIDV